MAVMFWFQYNNITNAIWALISSFMAVALLLLHVMHAAMKLSRTPSQYINNAEDPSSQTQRRKRYMALFVDALAMSGMTLGLLTGVAYFGYGVNTEGFVIPSAKELPYSHYTTSAVCLLTLVWSSVLLGFSRSYRKQEDERQPLIQETSRQYMAISMNHSRGNWLFGWSSSEYPDA